MTDPIATPADYTLTLREEFRHLFLIFRDILSMYPIGKNRIENIAELSSIFDMLKNAKIQYPVIRLTRSIESSNSSEKISPHYTTGY